MFGLPLVEKKARQLKSKQFHQQNFLQQRQRGLQKIEKHLPTKFPVGLLGLKIVLLAKTVVMGGLLMVAFLVLWVLSVRLDSERAGLLAWLTLNQQLQKRFGRMKNYQ